MGWNGMKWDGMEWNGMGWMEWDGWDEMRSNRIRWDGQDCLGPLLFLLYVNDLPFALKKAWTNMYAANTMTSCYSKTLDELHMVLNAELVVIEK